MAMRFLLPVLLAIGFTCYINAQAPDKVDPVAVARTTLEHLAKGDFAAIVATFDDKVRAALPADVLAATWKGLQGQFGAIRTVGTPRLASKADLHIVVIPVEFERATLEMRMVVTGAGRIAAFTFAPTTGNTPFVDASYVVPANFAEQNVTVDVGGWPLPGVLATPNGSGRFPAVVLVHGSGPNDRDQSLGPNKPFRDLAHGLASQGIAVLRYEKRSRQHPKRGAAIVDSTVKDEVIDDAVAAVRLLSGTPGIDPKRIFVLGLSLGGTLAPRIAQAAGADVAGLVIMAGAVRPLDQLLIEQSRYLAMADGKVSPGEQAQIDRFEQLAAAVKQLKPGDPPPAVPGVDVPTSYWLDLRAYNPAEAAAALKIPMLILQGARDYQVTTVDFDLWKRALGTRKDVTLKLYPALNHLFMSGTARSLPTEYLIAGHVDEQVVRDIAEWINARAK